MSSRLITFVALGLVTLGGALVAWVVVSGRGRPQLGSEPLVGLGSPEGEATKLPAIATPKPSPQEPTPKPKLLTVANASTWQEIEQCFENVRQKRKTEPAAVWELWEGYQSAAKPAWSSSKDYPEHITNLGKWRDALPKSPTPLVVMAGAHIKWAWQARGVGWASSVTEEGWELFHTRLTEARKLVDQAIELGVQDGEAHTVLLTLALAESLPREQARAWLDEGRKIDPTYYPLYMEMANGLQPRWGGEPGDVERFAAEVVQMLPGDDGLEAYGRIAQFINMGECAEPATLLWGEYDRKLLSQAADVLIKRYPKWQPPVQFAALCALANQDHEAAQRIRPLVGPYDENHRVWVWEDTYNHFLYWADAKVPPTNEEASFWAAKAGSPGLAFSGDARYLWCAQRYGASAVNLVDLESRTVRVPLPHPGGVVHRLTVDNDRNWIAVCAENGPFIGWMLWDMSDLSSSKARATKQRVLSLALHPMEPIVAWAEGQTVRFMDLPSEKVHSLEFPKPVTAMRYSADGTLLVLFMGQTVIWDVAAKKLRYDLPSAHRNPPSPMETNAVLSIDEEGRAWAIATAHAEKPIRTCLIRLSPDGQDWDELVRDMPRSQTLMLSPDRRLLAAARDANVGQDIVVFDTTSGEQVYQFGGHWNGVSKMCFSEDGKKLASMDGMKNVVKIWSLDDASGHDPHD